MRGHLSQGGALGHSPEEEGERRGALQGVRRAAIMNKDGLSATVLNKRVIVATHLKTQSAAIFREDWRTATVHRSADTLALEAAMAVLNKILLDY